jgi:hypothetical protein
VGDREVTIMTKYLGAVVSAAAILWGATAAQAQTKVNADAAAIADFTKRVNDYAAFEKKLDATIKEPSADSQPQAFLEHQRALAKLLQKARASAKPGDLCPGAMRSVIRRLIASVLRGPGGAQVRRSILDENPGNMVLTINSEYPDDAPFATVPPQILQGLPRLPEALEYRFLGKRLLLIDSHARVVADIIERVFP